MIRRIYRRVRQVTALAQVRHDLARTVSARDKLLVDLTWQEVQVRDLETQLADARHEAEWQEGAATRLAEEASSTNTTANPQWRDLSAAERDAVPIGTTARVDANGEKWTKGRRCWMRFCPSSPNLTDCKEPPGHAYVQVPLTAPRPVCGPHTPDWEPESSIRITTLGHAAKPDEVEEWTDDDIRDLFSDQTPGTCLVLALLERALRAEIALKEKPDDDDTRDAAMAAEVRQVQGVNACGTCRFDKVGGGEQLCDPCSGEPVIDELDAFDWLAEHERADRCDDVGHPIDPVSSCPSWELEP